MQPDGHFIHPAIRLFKPNGHFIHPAIRLFKSDGHFIHPAIRLFKPDGHFIHLAIRLFKPNGHSIHPAIYLFKNRRMPIKVSLPVVRYPPCLCVDPSMVIERNRRCTNSYKIKSFFLGLGAMALL